MLSNKIIKMRLSSYYVLDTVQVTRIIEMGKK